MISKDVLSQVDGLVAFKLTSSQDRDALEGWIEGQADRAEWKSIRAQLPTMERGQGVVWIPGRGVLETALFPPKRTFDSSRTPKRGEKQRSANLQPLDLGMLKQRLAKVEAEKQADDPKKLRERISVLERDNRKLEQERDAARAAEPPAVDVTAIRDAAYHSGIASGRNHIVGVMSDLRRDIESALTKHSCEALRLADLAFEQAEQKKSASPAELAPPRSPIRAQTPRVPAPPARTASPAASGDASLTNPQRTLLRAMAWWRAMGQYNVSRAQLAVVCKWSPASSNVRDRLSEVSKLGLVEYPDTGMVRLTDAGIAAAPAPDTAQTLVDSIRSILSNPQRLLFDRLLDAHNLDQTPISRPDLAAACGWSPDSSNIRDRLSELSRLELVTSRQGVVELQSWVTG
ncbi:hypothetical protein H8A97_30450 [Bradyrhizobium sp. Arg62]|uniref:hypothetical protein n=1 Tax=Bradyrhizobium brasilense TaxID=1419277 RepID=UPI001E64B610|nr:hypothetical protein [Bradyrhizobium brasilense]MCC8949307.1 hypothetical protein [Bradyrhizobium brasilense]